METNFNFNSQVCTSRSQSKKLLALGLKPETADMSSDGWNDPVVSWGMEWSEKIIESGRLPAWSLHRLLCLYKIHYLEFMGDKEIASAYDIVIDAITQAIKGGYFPKEYLV